MNAHGAKPPDEIQSKAIELQNESILSEAEIKQEPGIKQEPEAADDDLTMTCSTHTVIGSLDNSIAGTEVNDSHDCFDFYDPIEVKAEVFVDKVEEPLSKNYSGLKSSGMDDGAINKVSSKTGKVSGKGNNFGKTKKTTVGNANANAKRHKCTSCDYSTDFPSHLKQHILTHTGERPFPCSVCQKRFKFKQNLQSHMQTHVDEFLFSCVNCLQGFDCDEEKEEHEISCKARRYECYLCKEFSTFFKTHLKRHMRVHTGERPFKCDVCLKKFKRTDDLKKHRKTHTNPRPMKFKCSTCFKLFVQPKEKENHEVNCNRRGYRCDVCKSYTTDRKDNLMSHMRMHTGEKPFQCEKCSKRFSQKSSLIQHQKVHK